MKSGLEQLLESGINLKKLDNVYKNSKSKQKSWDNTTVPLFKFLDVSNYADMQGVIM